MKNLFLGILLGIFLIVNIAANVNDIITVKPSTPINTSVITFNSFVGIEHDIKVHVLKMVNQGYILKSITLSEGDMSCRGIVVMEKY